MAKLVTLQGMGFCGTLGDDAPSGAFQDLFNRDGDTVFAALAEAMQPIVDKVEAQFEAAVNDADQAVLSDALYRLRRIQSALRDANIEDLNNFPTSAEKIALLDAYHGNAQAALMAILPSVALLPEKYVQTRESLISLGVPAQNIDTIATAAKEVYDPAGVASYNPETGQLDFSSASPAGKKSALPVLAALAAGIYLATR